MVNMAEALEWPDEYNKWEDVEKHWVKPKTLLALVVGPRLPHHMVENPARPGQWACRECGARASTTKLAEKLRWQRCPGTVLRAAARPAKQKTLGGQAFAEKGVTEVEPFLGHAIWRYGPLHFCAKCGYYAEHRFIGLERPCTGRPAKNYGPRLALLAAGLHPKTKREFGQPPVRVTPAEAQEWQQRAAGL